MNAGWGLVWKLLLSRLGLFKELFSDFRGENRDREAATRQRRRRGRTEGDISPQPHTHTHTDSTTGSRQRALGTRKTEDFG